MKKYKYIIFRKDVDGKNGLVLGYNKTDIIMSAIQENFQPVGLDAKLIKDWKPEEIDQQFELALFHLGGKLMEEWEIKVMYDIISKDTIVHMTNSAAGLFFNYLNDITKEKEVKDVNN